MAVGEAETTELLSVAGINLSAVSAGIKTSGRLDVVLIDICDEANIAGAYTQNAFCAAPVTIAKKHSAAIKPRYFLINTGNANAGTGEPGLDAALECCNAVSIQAGAQIQPTQVLPFSTGVIGELLPAKKIITVLPEAFSQLAENNWLDAARGIMTTDTRPKAYSTSLEIDGQTVTITGIAKGAGMIKPNMATMLGYIFTDANIEQGQLQAMLLQALHKSFNRITIDGDTSTNDCCMLVATGKSGVKISSEGKNYQSFKEALIKVFVTLAQGLVKDAEGASKFVTIRVEDGLDSAECLLVAYTIAESPLVKTALFASDPNWGRILAAVGRAGVKNMDINAIEIYLGEVCIVEKGGVCSSYTEAQGQAVMNKDEIRITVKLGRGSAYEEIWTSDLSYDYVKINAEYRT